MIRKFRGKRALRATSILACSAIAVVGTAAPANATQLSDNTNSITCGEVLVTNSLKAQYCATALVHGDSVYSDINGIADVTVYKKDASGQWVLDPAYQVSVDSAQLFVNDSSAGGVAYPSGPVNGRASASTRNGGHVDRTQVNTVYVKAKFGAWHNGQEIQTVDLRTVTVSIPAGSFDSEGNWSVPYVNAHPNSTGALNCVLTGVNASKKFRSCVDTNGNDAYADVVALKKVNGQWVFDADGMVSVDSVVNFVDGNQEPGVAYPTGPQLREARASTRGHTSLDPSVSHATTATAKTSYWRNGQPVKSASLVGNLGVVAAG